MGKLSIAPSEVANAAFTIKTELVGAIDAESIQDLTNHVDKLCEEGTAWFLVDMRGVKYVNSTGLGQLVHYADRFTARGGGMILYALPSKVKVIIKMLGLDSLFPIVNSFADALRTIEKHTEAAPPEPQKPAPTPNSLQPPAQASEADMSQENLLNLVQSLTEEQKRTNRLLKAIILELRQLREELDED